MIEVSCLRLQNLIKSNYAADFSLFLGKNNDLMKNLLFAVLRNLYLILSL